MNWRFWRKPAPAAPKATEDWAAGDLAQCIATGGWFARTTNGELVQIHGPPHGSVHRVGSVRVAQGAIDYKPEIGLLIGQLWLGASSFVKLRPASEEFIASITRKVDA